MDHYPKVTRPCPVADRLNEVMDGDVCRQCDKRVLDLDTLSTAESLHALLSGTGEMCVSYRRPSGRVAIAAATLAAGLGLTPLPASVQVAPSIQAEPAAPMSDEVVVGGIPKLSPAERARYEREARKLEREQRDASRRAKTAIPSR